MWFKNYYFGFMTSTILMMTLKNLAGVYRPNFIALCNPAVNCTKDEYIDAGFHCVNISDDVLAEMRKSFTSGHVVLSVYGTVYLMWYLHTRLAKFPLLLGFVNTILLSWLVVCSVTRVTDHWHHTADVLMGLLIALSFNIFVCFVLCKNFKLQKRSYELY